MEEAYIGVIVPWAPDFAPLNWLLCQGQDLVIAQYQALYSLIGTRYGQSSPTTFKLPDLRGKVLVGTGTVGTTNYQMATVMGSNSTTIAAANLPVHTHSVTSQATVTGGTSGMITVPVNIPINTDAYDASTAKNAPDSNCTLGVGKTSNNLPTNIYTTKAPTTGVSLKPFDASGTFTVPVPTVQVTSTGGNNTTSNVPLNNMQNSMCINYIICVNGLYPQRP
jgi:Microcystin-dependent protein